MSGAEAGMHCLPAADGVGVAALGLQLAGCPAVARDLPAGTLTLVQSSMAWAPSGQAFQMGRPA